MSDIPIFSMTSLLVKCLELLWVLKIGFEHFTLVVSWIVTTYICFFKACHPRCVCS